MGLWIRENHIRFQWLTTERVFQDREQLPSLISYEEWAETSYMILMLWFRFSYSFLVLLLCASFFDFSSNVCTIDIFWMDKVIFWIRSPMLRERYEHLHISNFFRCLYLTKTLLGSSMKSVSFSVMALGSSWCSEPSSSDSNHTPSAIPIPDYSSERNILIIGHKEVKYAIIQILYLAI